MAEAAQYVDAGSLKRPAELDVDQEAPATKSPRLDNLPDALPGTVVAPSAQYPAGPQDGAESLQQQLAAALADGARWREECEDQRRLLDLAQQKITVLEGLLGDADAGGRQGDERELHNAEAQTEGQEMNGIAEDLAAAAKIKSLQSQLTDAKGQVDMLRNAAKGHVQKITQLELQLKQAQSDSRGPYQGAPHAQWYGRVGQQHRSPGGMGAYVQAPRPGHLGMPQQQGFMHGSGGGGGYSQSQAAAGGWGTPHAQQQQASQYYGTQQQQVPQQAQQQVTGQAGYYDWSSWGAQQAQQPQQALAQQGAEGYWGSQAYQTGAPAQPQAVAAATGAAVGAAGVQPQTGPHAPYYTHPQGPAAAAVDPYTQQAQIPAAVFAAPATGGSSGGQSRSSEVDVEQIWAELDQRKRDVLERFARSYPIMVDPSQAKEMCITDFRDMTEAQLEGFFMWLPGHCNPSKQLRYPGGFIRVKHTEWKKLFGM